MNVKPWMRVLIVKLKSTKFKKEMVFGKNYLNNKPDLDIKVNGYKYIGAVKDNCVVKISNLTYNEVIQIINGEFFDIEIIAGYRNTSKTTIFKGGIVAITNSLGDGKTNTIILSCANELVAKYHKKRLKLSFNSGINMYSAIKFICRRNGIYDEKIAESFKNKYLQDTMNVDGTIGSFLEDLYKNNKNFNGSADSSDNSTFNIFDMQRENNRIINLDSSFIQLSGGYPQLNSNGIDLTILPTFAFMPSDVIKIDNSILDLAINSDGIPSSKELSKPYYLDSQGLYVILEVNYQLENRGPNFSYVLHCRARNLMTSLIGANSK